MCSITEKCILCIKTDKEIIKIFSDRGLKLKIADILLNHFWFSMDELNENEKGICIECWQNTEAFNNFYRFVQQMHHNFLSDKKPINVELVECSTDELIGENSDSQSNDDEDVNPIDEEDHLKETKRKVPQKKRPKKTKAIPSIVSSEDQMGDKYDSELAVELEKRMTEFFEMNCDSCWHRFDSLNDAKSHYRSKHNIRKGYLKCCDKKFHLRSRIIDHINWHINPNVFQCQHCPKKFHEKRMLAAHALRHLDDEKRNFECDQCHKRFSRRHILNRHIMDVHPTGDNQHTCESCQKNFKSEYILKAHKLKVHERIDQRICDVCAKVFKTKEGFQEHMLSHSDVKEPRLECNYCGASLKNRGSLNKHMKLHTETPVECDICHKTKPTRSALNHHKRIVHGDAIHQCTICDKTFKRLLVLTEHIASHTGENLYTCPYCPKMFKSNSNMHKHRKQVHFEKWRADRETKKNAFLKK